MNAGNGGRHEDIQKEWTDQYVMINPQHSELKRFEGIVGRVVTVNWNDKAVVDFQDGGWYDIAASPEYLTKVDPGQGKAKYKNVNSAQPYPDKQG